MKKNINYQISQTIIQDCPYSCSLFFWGTCVRIHSDVPDVIERFKRLYSCFAAQDTLKAGIICGIVRSPSSSKSPVLVVDQQHFELSQSAYVQQAELILFHYLLDRLENHIVLHAGVVTREGRALVIYGQSGFGKTTLTLELLRRGYGFMSDEFCPIRISDALIEPFERQVSLKKNSPFYTFFDEQQSLFCDRTGTKSFDCDSVFSYPPAKPSLAFAFIEITPTENNAVCPPDGVSLDICMCHDGSAFPDALGALPDVEVTGPFRKGTMISYRVIARNSKNFLARFNNLWAEHNNDIFSVAPYKGSIETFNSTPALEPVPAFKALTSIASNVVNRCPTSRLFQNHDGKNSSLVMLLGRLLKETPCFSLQPGHLSDMADLIDNLL